MTKISVYNIDENVTADDKWIGTDVNTYNRTKNFTARKLSNYFNGGQVINTGVDLLYKYFTIDPSETRPTGTLSFETEIGPTVNFSSISTFLLSNTTLKGNYIVEFFNFLVGTKVLIYKAKNINLFGNYKIVSVEEYLPEPNFFIVNVEFIDGNGFIEEDEDYMISVIDIDSGVTNLSYTPGVSNGIVSSDNGTDAVIPLADDLNAGLFSATEKSKLVGIATGAEVNVNSDWNATTGDAQILNKPTISGTNTGDQNLQKVTDEGANTTNGITIDTGDTYEIGLSAISSGIGVKGESIETYGVYGTSPLAGIYGNSDNGYGVQGYSESGVAVYGSSQDQIGIQGNSVLGTAISAYSEYGVGLYAASESNVGVSVASNSIGLEVNGNGTIAIEANLGNSNKGLVINSGTSSTGNPIVIDKNGVEKLIVNQEGELTAQKLIKNGGTSSEILAADGSIITAGTNITITNGEISSIGGGGGGGSTVNYYLNGGTSQGTFGGATYYEFSKTAVIGTAADFNINTNGYIASFITNVADPSLLLIPAGNWNLEFFFSSSSAGGSPSFYVELYKYDGTTFTLIVSNSANPEGITGGTAIDAYFTPLAVPETILTVNDRLAIRVFVNASSKTITLHTQNGHLCEVITTFTAGLTALNGLQAQVQNFATGTTGTDFDIQSSGSTHTFNLPSASATARGAVTTTTQTFAGAKTFANNIAASANIIGTNTPDISNASYSIIIRNASTGVFEKLGATTIQPLIYNILITSTVGITTQTLGTNGGLEYSQDGRNVMIDNGSTPIQVTATNASSSFIASYTKLGTGIITFASSPAPIAPYGTQLNGNPGSTALLTKNGTTVYLLVNNLL